MQSLYSQQRTRIGTSAGAHTRSPKIMGHCWICVISVCIPLSTWILWICKLTNRYFVVSSLLFFFYIYTNKQQRVRERETSIFGSLFSWVARSFSFGFYSSKRKAHRMVNLKTKKKKGKSERHRVGFLYRRSSSFRVPNLPSMNSTGNIHTILQLYLRRNNKAVDTRLPRFRDRPLFFPFRVYVLWKEGLSNSCHKSNSLLWKREALCLSFFFHLVEVKKTFST